MGVELAGGGAPYSKVTAHGHGPTGDSDLRLYTGDRSSTRPSLQLLDAVGMHPETAAAAPDVAAAGRNWVRPLNTDIRLVKVQGFAEFNAPVAESLQVELVEQREAIIHVFEGEVGRGDPGALV